MNTFNLNTTVEAHYDINPGFADALNYLLPEFEYPNWSHKTIGEVLDTVSAQHVAVIMASLNGIISEHPAVIHPIYLANPPSSNPSQLLAMSEKDYDHAQEQFHAAHGKYSGSLRGLPVSFAHEVRDIFENALSLHARQLCARFIELYDDAHKDAKSWMCVGLLYALKARPERELTTDVEIIINGIVNQTSSVLGLVKSLGSKHYSEQILDVLVTKYGWRDKVVVLNAVEGTYYAGVLKLIPGHLLECEFDRKGRYLAFKADGVQKFDVDCRDVHPEELASAFEMRIQRLVSSVLQSVSLHDSRIKVPQTPEEVIAVGNELDAANYASNAFDDLQIIKRANDRAIQCERALEVAPFTFDPDGKVELKGFPHEITFEQFTKFVTMKKLENHGRQSEVFLGGKSLGFCDSSVEEEAFRQAHSREINNAIYTNTEGNLSSAEKVPFPPAHVLAEYPDLIKLWADVLKTRAPITNGIHSGIIVAIEAGQAVQKVGRDPDCVVRHDLSSLDIIPRKGCVSDICYSLGRGTVKEATQEIER